MGRHVHHPEPLGREHHRDGLVRHAGKTRQQFGVADADPSCLAERFFVQRCRDDAADFVIQGKLGGSLEVLIGRAANLRAHSSAPDPFDVDVVQVDQVDDARMLASR